ncbi:MAG: endonuclease MutS2, partial [Thermoanaerobaculia bacterium]
MARLVALEAKSEPGRRAVLARTPARTLEECERRQAELSEMIRFISGEGYLPLAGVTDVEALLTGSAPLEIPESWIVLRAMRGTQAVREAILRLTTPLPHLIPIAEGIEDLGPVISNIGKFFSREGKLRDDASPQLRSIRSRIHAKRSAIQKTLSDLMNRHAEAIQDPIVTLRNDRYCIPVRTERRSEIPGILHERSGSGASVFIEPMAVVETNNDLAELLIQEREEIARITRHIAQNLIAASPQILASIEGAGILDGIQACAVMHRHLEANRPSFTTERRMKLIDARHPLIDERIASMRETAFGERDASSVVPLTIEVLSEQRALVVTGPNAGGKTVALKTAGLLTAMAAAGFPVPAAEGSIVPVVDSSFVLIGDDQDVLEHLSTFSAYLVRLRHVLERATERSLVLLDELGGGTDPEEGSALAAAVIEHLVGVGCLTIVTTHLSALKSFAVGDVHVANAAMEFDGATGRPTYRLIPGVPGRSRAIDIAQMMGLPRAVVESARARLGERYGELDALVSELQRKMSEVVV